jgi:hypothetical protein
MSKTLAASVVDGLIVAAFCEITPADRDWQGFIDLLKAPDAAGLLIYSAGGAPGALRRLDLRYAFGSRDVRVAIVSDSADVRTAAMMLAHFVSLIRDFRCSALPDALAYLMIPAERYTMIEHELRKLRAEAPDLSSDDRG